MVRDELSVLSVFLAVAEERSFTRAAKRLGVSTSALSHAIKGLDRYEIHFIPSEYSTVAVDVVNFDLPTRGDERRHQHVLDFDD